MGRCLLKAHLVDLGSHFWASRKDDHQRLVMCTPVLYRTMDENL